MKFLTLIENTACREDLCAGHGLSLYIETPKHKILFDMGPSAAFTENAAALNVDLTQVDVAFLSHGHFDHSGGMEAFLKANETAPVYLHKGAFGSYWSAAGGDRRYIGVDPALRQYASRFTETEGTYKIDEELTLFDAVPDEFGAMGASASLRFEPEPGSDIPDDFRHEHNLLITAEGKTVLCTGDLSRPSEDFPYVDKPLDLMICESAHFPTTDYLPVLDKIECKKICVTHYSPKRMLSLYQFRDAMAERGENILIATDGLEILV